MYEYHRNGQAPVILHLGDHDPSGIDMSRDIEDRINTFFGGDFIRELYDRFEVHYKGDDRHSDEGRAAWSEYAKAHYHERPRITVERIALNMDQVHEYDPPPNFAKTTDARFRSYAEEYGEDSWELDALEPSVLDALVRDTISDNLDLDLFQENIDRQDEEAETIQRVATRWDEVQAFVAEGV